MRRICASLAVIFGTLALIYFWVGVPGVYKEHPMAESAFARPLEFFGRSYKEIEIYAFYFIPNDRILSEYGGWKEEMENNLKRLQNFHTLQFRGNSRISYRIFPHPVEGLRESFFYDTQTTQAGNPWALIQVSEELNRRVFKEDGDLYSADFAKKPENTYRVFFVLYEGVGASGGVVYESENESIEDIAREFGIPENLIFMVNIDHADGFFLLNRDYLALDQASGLFAHEFYHTLGFPDGYESQHALPTSEDVMGSGRHLPLEKTYLHIKRP